MTTTYATEVEEVLVFAREQAVDFGQEIVTSEFILHGILKHEKNSGIEILEKNGANLTKLRTGVKERLKSIKKDIPFEVIPRFSAQLQHIFNFAQTIASTQVTAESLIFALYRTKDSMASRILAESGYS